MKQTIIDAIQNVRLKVDASLGDGFSKNVVLELLNQLTDVVDAQEEKVSEDEENTDIIRIDRDVLHEHIKEQARKYLRNANWDESDFSIEDPAFNIRHGNEIEVESYSLSCDLDFNCIGDDIADEVLSAIDNKK